MTTLIGWLLITPLVAAAHLHILLSLHTDWERGCDGHLTGLLYTWMDLWLGVWWDLLCDDLQSV